MGPAGSRYGGVVAGTPDGNVVTCSLTEPEQGPLQQRLLQQ